MQRNTGLIWYKMHRIFCCGAFFILRISAPLAHAGTAPVPASRTT
jgi:hypothetical protein